MQGERANPSSHYDAWTRCDKEMPGLLATLDIPVHYLDKHLRRKVLVGS